MSAPVVLGINSVYHESSACVLRGTDVIAVAEEERFNRRKHAKPAEVGTADEVPGQAIRDCLIRSGVTPREIEYIAYSFDPDLRCPFIDEPRSPGSWGTPDGEQVFLAGLARVPEAVGEVLDRDVHDQWVWVPHELAHAASAYFASPFEDAAVLAMDGIGEHSTALLAHGRGHRLEPLKRFSYPHSLGFVWEKISKFIGLDEYGAPKVMALAAFAGTDRFRVDFEKLVTVTEDGFEIDADSFRFRVDDYAPLEELFGPRTGPNDHIGARDADLAAALQGTTESVLLHLGERAAELTGADSFCMAGGVALNCVAMGRLMNEGPFERLFVQPMAHDAGTALGAALWVVHTRSEPAKRYVMESADMGPAYDDRAVEDALARASVSATRTSSAERQAARLVEEGLIVGWFQGAAEVGPRALGNRTIVADPRRAGTKELINLKVKQREYFRPFAPSVLEERGKEWFGYSRESLSTRFMSFAFDVRPDKRALVPAVLHVDGTSRVQTVSADVNPRFHALISEFERRTGVPLVLNTSFNTFDEPIVCSPDDALRTFLRTGLDALVIHDYVVRKS